MNKIDNFLVFSLSGLHYALPVVEVERILHAIEIIPVPRAPEIVMGLINIQGQVIPVLNIRKLFHLPETEIGLNDHIIIARTNSRRVAILVDNVLGVNTCNEQDIIGPDELFPGIEYLEGVVKLNNGIIYIYNLERLYSSETAAEVANFMTPDISTPDGPERG